MFPPPPSLASLFAWWVTSSALWLVAINRFIGYFPDSVAKRLGMAAALVGLGVLGTACALAWRGWQGLVVPAAVLGVLAIGEVRRAALRYSYLAPRPLAVSSPAGGLFRPVTTTDLVARHYQIQVPELPVPRLRIAHLSDLHIGGGLPLEYYRSAFELAETYAPDVLVITGDLVHRRADLAPLREVLATTSHPSRGSFAVLGNHDHWIGADEVRQIARETGFNLVHARCQSLGLSESNDVYICGDEHPWGPHPASYPAQGTVVVLSHTPDNVYAHSNAGATVVFAGHVHAGQFRLPGLGAVAIPSRYGRRFDRGHFRVGATHLFVSSGVGGVPLRLWCEPDLLVVDLVPG